MAGPKNSIGTDPTPFMPPRADETKLKKPKKTDWARLANSRKYKEINTYLEIRKEYWRHYLPGGDTLKELAVKDPTKAGQWAGIASIIVDEIESVQFKIEGGRNE